MIFDRFLGILHNIWAVWWANCTICEQFEQIRAIQAYITTQAEPVGSASPRLEYMVYSRYSLMVMDPTAAVKLSNLSVL